MLFKNQVQNDNASSQARILVSPRPKSTLQGHINGGFHIVIMHAVSAPTWRPKYLNKIDPTLQFTKRTPIYVNDSSTSILITILLEKKLWFDVRKSKEKRDFSELRIEYLLCFISPKRCMFLSPMFHFQNDLSSLC